MDTQDAIRRIQKCLALSKSSNEGEAAAGLRQAQKLMTLYHISEATLTVAQVGEAGADTSSWKRPAQWEMNLGHTIKAAFGCEFIIRFGYADMYQRSNSRFTQVVFVGHKTQVELAAYAFSVLRRQCVAARAKYVAAQHPCDSRGEKIVAGQSFCEGFILNIKKQVQALVVDPAIKSIIDEKVASLVGGRDPYKATKRSIDYEAAQAGLQAGKDAALHRPVGQAARKEVLG